MWTRPTQNEALPRFRMTGWIAIVPVTGQIFTWYCYIFYASAAAAQYTINEKTTEIVLFIIVGDFILHI